MIRGHLSPVDRHVSTGERWPRGSFSVFLFFFLICFFFPTLLLLRRFRTLNVSLNVESFIASTSWTPLHLITLFFQFLKLFAVASITLQASTIGSNSRFVGQTKQDDNEDSGDEKEGEKEMNELKSKAKSGEFNELQTEEEIKNEKKLGQSLKRITATRYRKRKKRRILLSIECVEAVYEEDGPKIVWYVAFNFM
ncbi:unnamed protein product [Microthlaspi erraticum]|uniref:Uncharacterized protein n=1 Tax=Microthlaspi erraticum TaxID=1685480 RepID=A0A6D2J310_9BRAS|nr:unnamed protein product [Microthlaspi erraticum]